MIDIFVSLHRAKVLHSLNASAESSFMGGFSRPVVLRSATKNLQGRMAERSVSTFQSLHGKRGKNDSHRAMLLMKCQRVV